MKFLRKSDGSAAVEAAVFVPIFLLFMFSVTDLGLSMYIRTTVNAAVQTGAMYAVVNSGSTCSSSGTPTLTTACLSGIKQAMNDATADASFCSGTVCSASISPCADGSPMCITVTASYPYTPLLPNTLYSWAMDQTAQYTATVRIQ